MAKVQVQPSGVHAVLAVDPGNTTGVAAGYVELQPTLKETLAGLDRRKAIELTGPWLEQGRELAELMSRFVFTANVESQLPLSSIHIVFEDFILRMPATTTNLTSIWVAAAAVSQFGLDPEPVPVEWQMPSAAKSKATDERLKLWGLWEVGSAHCRDAWRHFALRVDKLVGV